MNEFNEVTADNLRHIRGEKNLNQDQIGEILNIPRNAVSKIEGGTRALSKTEKSLLDLYFFGKMPFEIANQVLLKSVLEFTPLQWQVITILATKRGMKPGSWIADRIRTYLAFDKDAQETTIEMQPGLRELPKVAEDHKEYKTGGNF